MQYGILNRYKAQIEVNNCIFYIRHKYSVDIRHKREYNEIKSKEVQKWPNTQKSRKSREEKRFQNL